MFKKKKNHFSEFQWLLVNLKSYEDNSYDQSNSYQYQLNSTVKKFNILIIILLITIVPSICNMIFLSSELKIQWCE